MNKKQAPHTRVLALLLLALIVFTSPLTTISACAEGPYTVQLALDDPAQVMEASSITQNATSQSVAEGGTATLQFTFASGITCTGFTVSSGVESTQISSPGSVTVNGTTVALATSATETGFKAYRITATGVMGDVTITPTLLLTLSVVSQDSARVTYTAATERTFSPGITQTVNFSISNGCVLDAASITLGGQVYALNDANSSVTAGSARLRLTKNAASYSLSVENCCLPLTVMLMAVDDIEFSSDFEIAQNVTLLPFKPLTGTATNDMGLNVSYETRADGSVQVKHNGATLTYHGKQARILKQSHTSGQLIANVDKPITVSVTVQCTAGCKKVGVASVTIPYRSTHIKLVDELGNELDAPAGFAADCYSLDTKTFVFSAPRLQWYDYQSASYTTTSAADTTMTEQDGRIYFAMDNDERGELTLVYQGRAATKIRYVNEYGDDLEFDGSIYLVTGDRGSIQSLDLPQDRTFEFDKITVETTAGQPASGTVTTALTNSETMSIEMGIGEATTVIVHYKMRALFLVREKNTKEPLADYVIGILDDQGNVIRQLDPTDANGEVFMSNVIVDTPYRYAVITQDKFYVIPPAATRTFSLDPPRDWKVIIELERRAYRISGTLWLDTDNDGCRDAGEKLLSGITCRLYTQSGAVVTDNDDQPIPPLITDVNGYYEFYPVPEGTYQVRFDIDMEGYEPSPYNAPGVPNTKNSSGELFDDTRKTIVRVNDIKAPYEFEYQTENIPYNDVGVVPYITVLGKIDSHGSIDPNTTQRILSNTSKTLMWNTTGRYKTFTVTITNANGEKIVLKSDHGYVQQAATNGTINYNIYKADNGEIYLLDLSRLTSDTVVDVKTDPFYTVTGIIKQGGAISPATPEDATVGGTSVVEWKLDTGYRVTKITITGSDGYKLVRNVDDGIVPNSIYASGKTFSIANSDKYRKAQLTLTGIDQDYTVEVETEKAYLVEGIIDEGGTISHEDGEYVAAGEDTKVTWKIKRGYAITSVTLEADGETATYKTTTGTLPEKLKIGENEYPVKWSSNNNDASVVIDDIDTDICVTVKTSADITLYTYTDKGAQIRPNGTKTLPRGADQVIDVLENDGYYFKSLTITNDEATFSKETYLTDGVARSIQFGEGSYQIIKNDDGTYSVALKNLQSDTTVVIRTAAVSPENPNTGGRGVQAIEVTSMTRTQFDADFPQYARPVAPVAAYLYAGAGALLLGSGLLLIAYAQRKKKRG